MIREKGQVLIWDIVLSSRVYSFLQIENSGDRGFIIETPVELTNLSLIHARRISSCLVSKLITQPANRL